MNEKKIIHRARRPERELFEKLISTQGDELAFGVKEFIVVCCAYQVPQYARIGIQVGIDKIMRHGTRLPCGSSNGASCAS